MGYEEKKVEVTLNRNKKIEYLGKIKVSRSSVKLDEISINEDRPVYETKMEKIVYNAENDLNEGLDDAADVLRKAPLLSVDLEGNVSLRGSQNIKFLVNGKESTFFSGSASEALQMIPAEQVKSVEVITSPTAKYDGEGGAGIINIITQQKQISGFKATVNGSVGTRVNKQSFNVNYTPDGAYMTYKDGSPVAYNISLGFKEMEPVYDIDYDSGDGKKGTGF